MNRYRAVTNVENSGFRVYDKVVSTVLLSEAYCCRYLVSISPNSKVLISDTGSSSYASIDGYCGNWIAFSDAEIEAGSALRGLC